MPTVPEAIDALKAALYKNGAESHVQDAFNHLASCLVLLNSSSPSVQMIRKLCTVLRQPLLPLYNACLQPALQLSCAVLSMVLGKLCDAHNIEGESLRAAWDATAEVILSGILDFLDQKDGGDVESDAAVWEALYRIICEFFFRDSGWGQPVFSIPLCLSAYNTLTETAARQVTVRNALRHKAVLGGERLGAAISRTRGNYLVLEALLMLFARLLPPIHNISQGKSQRTKFVKEVLGSPKLFKCNAALLDIMQKTSETHWDDVAAQIIDVLARSDITYPQPFSIDEVDVCGRVFPQPLATDRLIMDRQAFLANIVVENDDPCESLQVLYSHIRTITLDNSEQNVPKGKVSIMVYLTSPPLVANVEMEFLDGSHHAKFLLQNDAVGRFMEALRRRGVGKLSFLNPLTRVQRKRKSISIGSGFKFINDSSPIPTASFEGKVQHVNQVYKTDIEDSTMSQAVPVPHAGDMGCSPTPNPKPTFKGENLIPDVLEPIVVEDGPATLHSAGLTSPINEMSNPIQNFAFTLPGNSTLLGDCDELSEISEFEPEDRTVNERGVSTPCNRELQTTHHRIGRMRMNGSSGATCAMETKKSSQSASKTGDRTEGVAQRSPDTGNPLLASDSPIFGSSSSTQINVSPKPLSSADALTPAGTEIVGGRSVASQDFVSTDRLNKTGVNGCGPFDTKLVTTSAGQPQTGLSSAEDELGQHTGRVTASSDANQQVRSRTKITKDASVPSKIVGSRRKREVIKSSSKAIIEVDDESTPPRKKHRNDRLAINEDKVKSDQTSLDPIYISRVKRYIKMAEGPSRGIDPTPVDFDGPPELKPSRQGTRRSSRIKKRQTAATGGTRAGAMHSKTQKGRQADGRLTCGVERRKLTTVFPQDTSVKTSHGTPSIPSSRPIPSLIRGSPSLETGNHVSLVELRSAENVTPEMTLLRETPKASTILPCQPGVKTVKEPRGNLAFAKQAASDAMQLVEEQFYTKTEEIIDDQHIVPDPCILDNNVSPVQEVVENSVSLKESEDPVELYQPIVESTPRTKTVTIDLTINNSAAREKNELHRGSANLVRLETDTQTKFTAPDQSGCIAIEEAAIVSSPRHRHRSVTFASPIEYVLDKKVKSKTQVSSLSRRSSSSSESNTRSPLGIPTGSVSMRRGPPDRMVTLQNSKSLQAHDQIADEVGIQDIIEVLNEIQAVIIKGISDKFRNVKKDVQRGRDELIQQVLDELQGMVVENAKYFNGLLRLEEDYYKNGKAITRCWEELIDINDGIATQVQKALKEHDQNISARTFPKSLLPLKPGFLRRRVNA